MSENRTPKWVKELSQKYTTGVAHMFLLHFNVADYVDNTNDLRSYLSKYLAGREILAFYNRAEGITFPLERIKQKFIQEMGLNTPPDPALQALRSVQGGNDDASLPRDPGGALPLLEKLLKLEKKTAVIMDFVETLTPEGDMSFLSPQDRESLIFLQRWARDPTIMERGNLVILITRTLTDIHEALRAASSRVEAIEIPLPDYEARLSYIEFLETNLQIEPKEFARLTAGLSKIHIEDIKLRAEEEKGISATEMVKERKKEIIKNEFADVIEILEPTYGFEAIGGMEQLKHFFQENIISPLKSGDPELQEQAPVGVLLTGPPGCLTGDTKIKVFRKTNSGSGITETLEGLYYRFNNLHNEGVKNGTLSKHKKTWKPNLKTRIFSLNEEKGLLYHHEIQAVIFSGVKEVYKLTTTSGFSIKATEDHEFYTSNGYVPLKDLAPGNKIITHKEGDLLNNHTNGRRQRMPVSCINNVGFHPYARHRKIKGLDYSSHPIHRLVVEAHMNNLTLEEFLFALCGDTSKLKFLDPKMEVHHEDGNRKNNTIGNLKVYTKEKHALIHYQENGNPNKFGLRPRTQKVASIEYIGKEPTFDITMKDPHHNFVANGFVVHNCGKSFFCRAIAKESGINCIKFDLSKILGQYVGSSERSLDRALKCIQALAPTLIILEEVDQVLQRGNGGGDSGVSSRIFGRLMDFMANPDNRGKVVFMANTNRPDLLDAALKRPGRLGDAIIPFLPPDEENREAVFKTVCDRRKIPYAPYLDWKAYSRRTDKYTHAELESIITKAWRTTRAEGGKELTPATVDHAMDTIKSSTGDVEFQTLLALNECTDKDLLPEAYKGKLDNRKEIEQKINTVKRGRREL